MKYLDGNTNGQVDTQKVDSSKGRTYYTVDRISRLTDKQANRQVERLLDMTDRQTNRNIDRLMIVEKREK